MEPTTRFVKSADGTNLAVWTLGQGDPPLVFVAAQGFGLWQRLWQIPDYEVALRSLAERRRLVWYDGRGQGLSDREGVSDFSLTARLDDLTAVIRGVNCVRPVLLGTAAACLASIAYAAQHPDDVARLILRNPVARGRDIRMSERRRALASLIDVDWDLYLQTLALVDWGWEAGRLFSEGMATENPRENLLASFAATREMDVTDLLSSVKCPALVWNITGAIMERPGGTEAARSIASAIPDAEFIAVDGSYPGIFYGNPERDVAVIERFLAGTAQQSLPSGTAIILFTDIADSTAITERIGDAAFREAARALDDRLRAAITEAGGTPVEGKVLGDGVMAVFTSAAQAIDAARRCIELSGESELRLHVGLHAGDVIRQQDAGGQSNVYGDAVNIASRICGLSAPGEILVSATIRDLARTSAGVTFEDRGDHTLKGIDDPLRVFAVTL